MTKDHDAIAKGVTDAWDFWLSQHDVTTPDCIVEAVGKSFDRWLIAHAEDALSDAFNKSVDSAVTMWLDEHKDELLNYIAKHVAGGDNYGSVS